MDAYLQMTNVKQLDDAQWDLGAPLADVRRLAKHWEISFDFEAFQSRLNKLPNFHQKIQVNGFEALDIHYIHQRSDSPDAIPLLFCHGWPGSYIEVEKLLEPLKQSHTGVSFHVVAPSLPNFGWSEGPKTRGFALNEYAETCHQLMLSLGYDQYVTQGGDWGQVTTREEDRFMTDADQILRNEIDWSSAPRSMSSQSSQHDQNRWPTNLERTSSAYAPAFRHTVY